jgi:hypothetical protein
MKRIQKLLLTAMLMIGLTACVGYVGDGPGYYHDHWYHDGPWMGGPRGYVGVGVHAGRW